MLINELFDQPTKWEVREQRPDYFDAKFTIGKIPYIMRMSSYLDSAGNVLQPSEWNVEFYADLDMPSRERYGILKTGNQMQVFATVVDIMREFIKNYKPDELTFSANEPSRNKLYKRMIDTLLPDWEGSEEGNEIILVNPHGRA